VEPEELERAKAQLHARLVFDADSVTNIAHQLGYFAIIAGTEVFETIESRIAAVTLEAVVAAGRDVLRATNRTVGWFEPVTGPSPVAGVA
jgi:predicted Zn-dependent peptidase